MRKPDKRVTRELGGLERNHYDATNATPAYQPIFLTGQINGNPAFSFQSANGEYLVSPYNSPDTCFTAFAVWQPQAGLGNNVGIWSRTRVCT